MPFVWSVDGCAVIDDEEVSSRSETPDATPADPASSGPLVADGVEGQGHDELAADDRSAWGSAVVRSRPSATTSGAPSTGSGASSASTPSPLLPRRCPMTPDELDRALQG